MILSRLPILAWYVLVGGYSLMWCVVTARAALPDRKGAQAHPELQPRTGGNSWLVVSSIGALGFMTVAGLVLLVFSLLSYGTQKALVDSLAADGVSEQFTPGRAQSLAFASALSSVGLLAAAGASWLRRERSMSFAAAALRRIFSVFARVSGDLRQMLGELAGLREDRSHLLWLSGITALGVLLRLAFLDQPIRYDEAFTFLEYASRGLEYSISTYTLPNNHLLHTALVALTTRLLGDSLFAIRLPAFLAGVMLAPVSYLATRLPYGRKAALLAAGLVSASSGLIEYSTNARGYSLVCLFTVALFGLGAYVRQRPNSAGWLLLATVGALGLFTLPTMLFPLGAVMLWLGISWLFREPKHSSPAGFLFSLLAAGLATGLMTIALYSPALVMSGIGQITSARAIAAADWDRTASDLIRLAGDTVGYWARDVPAVIGVVIVGGIVAYFILRRKIEDTRVPLAFTVLLWSAAVTFALRRVTLKAGVWLFLLPLVIMWASAGLAHLYSRIPGRSARRMDFAFSLGVMLTSIGLGVGVIRSNSVMTSTETGTFRSAEEVVLYLEETLRPGDRVVAYLPSDYPLRYYFERRGLDPSYFYQRGQPADFERALVIVNSTYDQSLEQIIEKAEIPGAIDLGSSRNMRTFETGVVVEILLSPQTVSHP